MKNKLIGFFEKSQPFFDRLGSSAYLQVISSAMMGTLGVIFVGSIAVLLAVLPSTVSALSFLAAYSPMFLKINNITIGAMSLYVVVLIAYQLVKRLEPEEDGISASIISLLCFLIITPLDTTTDGVTAIPATWLGAQGVFSAMIVGLVSARLYLEIKRRNLTIKMPASVPPMVSNIFESLVQTILIAILFIMINWLFIITSYGSMNQFIYSIIQGPLQGIGGNITAMIVISLICQLLWFFGIHGTNVTMPVVQALWMAMDAENLTALAAGNPLPNITGYAFFSIITWGGTSLGLVLLMLRAKSKQYREVGKIGLVPILFGIGEPVVFGTPLVLNFKLAIPLITNNSICLLISYICIKLGIVSVFSGVAPVFGMPIGLYAAFQGSVSIIVLHLILQFIIGPLLWYPWFKRLDKETYEQEQLLESAGK